MFHGNFLKFLFFWYSNNFVCNHISARKINHSSANAIFLKTRISYHTICSYHKKNTKIIPYHTNAKNTNIISYHTIKREDHIISYHNNPKNVKYHIIPDHTIKREDHIISYHIIPTPKTWSYNLFGDNERLRKKIAI